MSIAELCPAVLYILTPFLPHSDHPRFPIGIVEIGKEDGSKDIKKEMGWQLFCGDDDLSTFQIIIAMAGCFTDNAGGIKSNHNHILLCDA